MIAYGEFRAPFNKDTSDTRFVFYGMQYFLQRYLFRQWTMEDVERADKFYSTHNAGFTNYPYPKELFEKFVKEVSLWTIFLVYLNVSTTVTSRSSLRLSEMGLLPTSTYILLRMARFVHFSDPCLPNHHF